MKTHTRIGLNREHAYPVAVSARFRNIVRDEINRAGGSLPATVNFRSADYSPDTGGYHPVEVTVDARGVILYITDFAYVGGELVKEIDYDFGYGVFEHMGYSFPMARGRGLFRTWQANFCDYWKGGVYDSVKVC